MAHCQRSKRAPMEELYRFAHSIAFYWPGKRNEATFRDLKEALPVDSRCVKWAGDPLGYLQDMTIGHSGPKTAVTKHWRR